MLDGRPVHHAVIPRVRKRLRSDLQVLVSASIEYPIPTGGHLEAGAFVRLVEMEGKGELTPAQARTVLKDLQVAGEDPAAVASQHGLESLGADALAAPLDAVIADNADAWARYVGGRTRWSRGCSSGRSRERPAARPTWPQRAACWWSGAPPAGELPSRGLAKPYRADVVSGCPTTSVAGRPSVFRASGVSPKSGRWC